MREKEAYKIRETCELIFFVSWSMSRKYSTVGYLSKCCFQCVSYLLKRNFEHSCDQVTFKMPLLKKMPWRWRKSFSSKRPFLPLVLNKNNNKHADYHGIFILFKGQTTQNKRVTFLFCLGHGFALELLLMFGWSRRFYCQH